jgi:hypothetical protein
MQQQLQQQCRAGFRRQQQRQVGFPIAVDVAAGSFQPMLLTFTLRGPAWLFAAWQVVASSRAPVQHR